MKVVVDTNDFISGIFWSGTPRKILNLWTQDKVEWIVSVSILEEYGRVLAELSNKRSPAPELLDLFQKFALSATVVISTEFEKPVYSDVDDDKFLEAAVSANASIIVTGDKALLQTNGFNGIRVLTPADFLKYFDGSERKCEKKR